jgi:predicted dehydrogenase
MPVKLGFVGVGFMGQCAHLRNYAALDGCDVVAIAEMREGLAQEVAVRYGVPRVYRSHREMLENEHLDGIVASQQYCNHGSLIPELYQAGVPVFTEKPLACSVEMGEKLVAALERSKARHFVGYHKRSDPAVLHACREMRRLRRSSELGDFRYIRILMPAGDWIAGGDDCLIKSDEPKPAGMTADPLPAHMDAGTAKEFDVFVNFYIHQVNLMRHLLGEDFRIAYADPTGVLLAVKSESGLPGTIEMTPYKATVDWPEEVFIAFERGFIKLDLPAPLAVNRSGRVTLFRDPGEGVEPSTSIPRLPWTHAMQQQAVHFLAAIRGEDTPLCEAREALRDLRSAEEYIGLKPAR